FILVASMRSGADGSGIQPGIFVLASHDGGHTWAPTGANNNAMIADGSDGLPIAYGSPHLAFASTGVPYLTYLKADLAGFALVSLTSDGWVDLVNAVTAAGPSTQAAAFGTPTLALDPTSVAGSPQFPVWIVVKNDVANVVQAAFSSAKPQTV